MSNAKPTFLDVCLLSHGNWHETERALRSAWRLGLHIHLGLTVDGGYPFSHPLLSVYRVDWANDFAAARNALLDQITSERPYFLWIDSDEEILCCPAEAPAGLERLFFDVKLNFISGFTAGRRTSVHRNAPSIRWTGPIHERLSLGSSVPMPPLTFLHGLAVLHHGYEDDSIIMAKLLRNAAIAASSLAEGTDYPGSVLSMARLRAARGLATAHDWLHVYYATLAFARKYDYSLDECWEAAAALAYCGYTRPAARLSARNPLNLPLQLSLLISHRARTGHIDEERFAFILTCLQRTLWDDRFPFNCNLVRATREQFAEHVDREADALGWRTRLEYNENRNAPMQGNKIFIQCEDILAETFEDDTLLLSPVTNRVVSLNATGKVLWDAMEFGFSVNECLELLEEARGGQLLTDEVSGTKAFFQELLDAGLICEA
jgi:hypothetical protein